MRQLCTAALKRADKSCTDMRVLPSSIRHW
jgi:hypothetical protein